jgi:hypothetical protein
VLAGVEVGDHGKDAPLVVLGGRQLPSFSFAAPALARLRVYGPDQKVEDSHLREPVIATRESSLDLPQGGTVAIQVSLVTAHERGGVLSERP